MPRPQDKPILALREAHQKNGDLKLSQFRRIKQLGTGDVGLVDLVELAQDGSRYSFSSHQLLCQPTHLPETCLQAL